MFLTVLTIAMLTGPVTLLLFKRFRDTRRQLQFLEFATEFQKASLREKDKEVHDLRRQLHQMHWCDTQSLFTTVEFADDDVLDNDLVIHAVTFEVPRCEQEIFLN